MNPPYPTADLGGAIILVGTMLAAVFFMSLPGNNVQGEDVKRWVLTKREKIALVIMGILGIVFSIIPQDVINNWEPLFLLFVAFPLGLFAVTDPERKMKG